jgi:hypothetical protein
VDISICKLSFYVHSWKQLLLPALGIWAMHLGGWSWEEATHALEEGSESLDRNFHGPGLQSLVKRGGHCHQVGTSLWHYGILDVEEGESSHRQKRPTGFSSLRVGMPDPSECEREPWVQAHDSYVAVFPLELWKVCSLNFHVALMKVEISTKQNGARFIQ